MSAMVQESYRVKPDQVKTITLLADPTVARVELDDGIIFLMRDLTSIHLHVLSMELPNAADWSGEIRNFNDPLDPSVLEGDWALLNAAGILSYHYIQNFAESWFKSQSTPFSPASD
jgi:hypothetical protein